MADVLLVSTYELGHQPFSIASAWTLLEAAGHTVRAVDTSVETVDDELLAWADLVAISVPMHTALRLGVEVARRAQALRRDRHICLFGLYAWLNAESLLPGTADSVVGGEFEAALVQLANALASGEVADLPGVTTSSTLARAGGSAAPPVLDRLAFAVPRRDGLPDLPRYARLVGLEPGAGRIAGYVEASRGCLHRCRHCPITPVYDGRFFVIPTEVVLADAEQQVLAGARHITFGDPDFLNGPRHSMTIVRRLHAAHPDLTFDVTTKIEHILRHREVFRELSALGCVFVVSALESLSDRVLEKLAKGHTRSDVFEAFRILDEAGITLRPSLVPFTPWATLEDYLDIVDFASHDARIGTIDPIQLAIRLLVPPGSALVQPLRSGKNVDELIELRPWFGPLAPDQFHHVWTHPEPRMDALHGQVQRAVEQGARRSLPDRDAIFEIRELAYDTAGRRAPPRSPGGDERLSPKLSEPWFCCAEPSVDQLHHVTSRRSPERPTNADG
jgi:radical SAM superfamily enzyme YgiQ (UPF0313 family)